MAAGDVKDERAVVLDLTAGGAVAIGQVVHLEADGYYDVTAAADQGKFAVAIEAASAEGDTFRAVVYGPVEVTSTAAIPKGAIVMSGAAGAVTKTDFGAGHLSDEHVGFAMEAITNGGVGTVWIGVVG